jgi:4-amino-4-deoxy-L-arabinose transferase-like glycosyltransferase
LAAVPAAYLLYFHGLGSMGVIGPDEPRYASIAREMATSGDWITPRLWGQPWFEKSPLLYWISGAAFRVGLRGELAPRLPIAVMAVAFLVFYWWILRREFGCRAAWLSVLILGSSVAWVGFSQLCVTDLPLAATYSAAMLLALPWIAKGDARGLPVVSALLGVAALAKYLVAAVLAVPLGFVRWRSIRDLLRPVVVAPFVLIAAPWYVLCYLRNGSEFLRVAWEHQVGRFTTDALKHAQPWWFYLPQMAGLLLPWTPVVILLARRSFWSDPRRRFLGVLVLFGLVFFSASANKLPGYLLPLLPPAAALMGVALDEVRGARILIPACALLLVVFAAAQLILPAAIASGLSRAPHIAFHWTWLAPIPVAAAAWFLESRKLRLAAAWCVALGVAAGVGYLKLADQNEINRIASAHDLWQEIAPRQDQVCVDNIHRDWRYGLNFYSVAPLPECSQSPRPLAVVQAFGEPPRLTRTRAPL